MLKNVGHRKYEANVASLSSQIRRQETVTLLAIYKPQNGLIINPTTITSVQGFSKLG